MMKSLIICVASFHMTICDANGQIKCGMPPCELHFGDSSRASSASHRIEYTGRGHTIRLGYIDTTFATQEEIFNNLSVGLVVVPNDGWHIKEFSVCILPVGRDINGSYWVNGNKLTQSIMRQLGCIHPGDKMYFTDFKLQNESNITISIKKQVLIEVKNGYK